MDYNRKHPHAFICGLVYPAFLGAFIYEFFAQMGAFTFFQLLVIGLILTVYVFDFLYTNDCYGKGRYNSKRAILDLILVVTVYLGAKNALVIPAPDYTIVLGWLALFKFLNFLWESVPNNKVQLIPLATYLVFMAFYLVGWFEFIDPALLLLFVLVLDNLVSLNWDKYESLVAAVSGQVGER